MTAIIQNATQNDQLSSDAALKLERFQFLEDSTSELNKKNGLEKKKRPEEMADSLAALASAVWLRQPNDVKAQVSVKCDLNTDFNSFSEQHLNQKFQQLNEAVPEVNENSLLESPSGFTKEAAATTVVLLSGDSSIKNIDGFEVAELANSGQDNASANVNSGSQVSNTSAPSVTSVGSGTGAAVYRSQNIERSGLNSDLRVASTNPSARHSPDLDDRSSTVDLDRSELIETPSKPDLNNKVDQSDPESSDGYHKSKKEEVVDTAWTAPVIQQELASPELIPNASPQQFGNNLKRSAEQASATMNAPKKGSVEGVKYSFNSWGAGDNSVQITGSSRSGYKAVASNSAVGSILEKHLSENDGPSLTIESTTGNSHSEDLNIQAVEKIDQNNL